MGFDVGHNRQFGFSFDQSRCTGCKTCQMACKDYHDLGDEVSFRTVCEYAGGDWRQNGEGSWEQNVFAFYVSISCNHCANPVCIRLCTRGAIHKDSLGFVVVDRDVCDGCQMCMVACPYHAPRYDEETGRVAKCDGCRDRVKNGLGRFVSKHAPSARLASEYMKTLSTVRLWLSKLLPCQILISRRRIIQSCPATLPSAMRMIVGLSLICWKHRISSVRLSFSSTCLAHLLR